MKFQAIDQFHAKAGEYTISMAKIKGDVAFTLVWRGEILKTEKCADFASERNDAQRELIAFADDHFAGVGKMV